MNSLQRRLRIPVLLTLLAAGLTWAGSARANVYATDIKINGSQTNSVSTSQGASVAISYILNEAATAGVTINISSGGTVARTITIESGPGTAKGLNTVTWDGKGGTGNNVDTGTYSVSITAAATGFSDWTITSDNTSATTHVNRPYGIAVDNNTNSPYYGRIFIGNAHTLAGSSVTGDTIGIVKCNADGSYADDGAFSQFDYAWSDDGGDSPIGLRVLTDDTLYFNDWAVGKGKVVGVDPALTQSFVVWDAPNYANTVWVGSSSPNWLDFDIAFAGTDHPMLFAGDVSFPSEGVFCWYLTNNAGHLFADPTMIVTNDDGSTRCDNSAGQNVIQTGGDLSLRCDDIEVDVNTNLYVDVNRFNSTDNAMRAAMFPTWDGITTLFSGATWVVGRADSTFRANRGGAIDSRINPTKFAIPQYTANTNVGFLDPDANGWVSGGIRILNPVDGSMIYTNLCPTNLYRGVAWDNVGNLYAGTSGTEGALRSRWQAISPPGANQATTAALANIQITVGVTAPHITNINYNNGAVTINFTADSADVPTSFNLQSSSTVDAGYANVGSAVATQNSPGSFTFTTVATTSTQFYRISR